MQPFDVLPSFCPLAGSWLVPRPPVRRKLLLRLVDTSKIAEQISYVREILRAFGVPQEGPTFIGTDNTANQRVASGAAVPARSKHFLRRYHVLLERVRSREITIGHVPDRSMPADFLTKWIGASKLNVSVEHVTNRRHAPVQPEAI